MSAYNQKPDMRKCRGICQLNQLPYDENIDSITNYMELEEQNQYDDRNDFLSLLVQLGNVGNLIPDNQKIKEYYEFQKLILNGNPEDGIFQEKSLEREQGIQTSSRFTHQSSWQEDATQKKANKEEAQLSNKNGNIKTDVKKLFLTFMRSKLEIFGSQIQFSSKNLFNKYDSSKKKKSKCYLLLYFVLLYDNGKGYEFLQHFSQNYLGAEELKNVYSQKSQYFYQCFEKEIAHFLEAIRLYLVHKKFDELCSDAYKLEAGGSNLNKKQNQSKKCLKQLNLYFRHLSNSQHSNVRRY